MRSFYRYVKGGAKLMVRSIPSGTGTDPNVSLVLDRHLLGDNMTGVCRRNKLCVWWKCGTKLCFRCVWIQIYRQSNTMSCTKWSFQRLVIPLRTVIPEHCARVSANTVMSPLSSHWNPYCILPCDESIGIQTASLQVLPGAGYSFTSMMLPIYPCSV